MPDKKLSVGQEVYLLESLLYRKKNREDLIKTEITKVGRKYFYIQNSDSKFSIDTLREVNNINYQGRVYLTEQEHKDNLEHKSLYEKVTNSFRGYHRVELNLSQLRRINAIIEGADNE